jgi:hypothetical protein
MTIFDLGIIDLGMIDLGLIDASEMLGLGA